MPKAARDSLAKLSLCRTHHLGGRQLQCEHCGCDRMVLLVTIEQPSWKAIFAHDAAYLPPWHVTVRAADDRAFWDSVMGAGFTDWYLENVIESAEGTDVWNGLDELGRSHQQLLIQPSPPGRDPGLSELVDDWLHYH